MWFLAGYLCISVIFDIILASGKIDKGKNIVLNDELKS